MEPVNTRDPAAAARAYLALEWSLALGHRYRPKQGCTCGRSTTCAIPGAHPVLGADRLDEASVSEALESSPGAGLIAWTERFDAVLVPRQIGMAAMVLLDRKRPVTCLIPDPDTYALLVMPSTGRYAAVDPAVMVCTGEDGWIALPPSRGVRWDTPPWIEGTAEPRGLIHGDEIRHALADCFTVVKTGAAR
ncbi:hypothetical protein ACFXDF_39230 [Streptomyces sp. NPDC059426]|uniref:hypothetical protein n=1 Tax=Streptomyces sp. NPDC059426 TaxID=3346827 RepID=UPI0036C77932